MEPIPPGASDAMVSTALEDRVIVIVGGTTGIGLAGAEVCLRAGAKVAVGGLEDEESREGARRLGGETPVIFGDAGQPETVERVVAEAVERYGKLDGLYHVAGGSGRSKGDGPLHELTDEGLEYTLRLNLFSVFYSNRAAVCRFIEQGTGGAILNVSSVLAYAPAPRYFATHAYAAAKAGIIGLTRSAAASYAPHNIRINALAPALTNTPMARRALADAEIMSFIQQKQPLDGGRAGMVSDLDAAVVFFLSDASRFITGQVLAVDGGWGVCG